MKIHKVVCDAQNGECGNNAARQLQYYGYGEGYKLILLESKDFCVFHYDKVLDALEEKVGL